jgi:hypothetical protein
MLFLKAQKRERSKPRPTSRPLTKPRPNSQPVTRPREDTRPLTRPRSDPAAAQAAVAQKLPERKPVPLALYGAGFSYLRDRGQALFGAMRAPEAPADAEILSHCSDTLTHLTDLVNSHEQAGEAGDLADAIMEAESLVILLENESGEEAAVDAVSILLQIRREFELGLAA